MTPAPSVSPEDYTKFVHDEGLRWELLETERHAGIMRWVADLNRLYRSEPALHELDCEPGGLEWVNHEDGDVSLLSFLRRSANGDSALVVCNFTPVPRLGYRVGVPHGGYWREMLNSDAREYAGSGIGNLGGVHAEAIPAHGRPYSLNITLPPLAALFFKTQ